MPLAERFQFLDLRKEYGKEDAREFSKVLEWLTEAESASSETLYRESAEEDYAFYAGDQDTADVKATLKEQNRPNSTFNEIKPKIDMLIGLGAQVKYDGQVIPVGEEDEALAEFMQGTLLHFRQKRKLGRKELDCFEHMVKSGRSLLYFRIDKSNPFKPVVTPIRVPGQNFAVDPASLEYDLSDAKYFFVWSWVDEDDLKSIDEDINPSVLSGENTSYLNAPSYYDELTGKYRILTCWHRKWVKKYWFVNPLTGEPEGLTKSQFKQFVKAGMEGIEDPESGEVMKLDGPPDYTNSLAVEYRYITFSGNYIIESGVSPHDDKVAFPAVFYGAYKDDNNNRWFGAVLTMKDPQRAVNTMRRQLTHLLQTLPKGLLLHEVGAVLDVEKYEERSSEPNFHMELGKGGLEKVKFEKQPSISPVYQILDEIMRKSIKDSSGVQDDLMGNYTASREPGITVQTRKESALAVLFILFNNYRESRLEGNKKFMYLLQQYVRGPEIIRINGEKAKELMWINSQINPQNTGFNDVTVGEYDLEMEETVETGSFKASVTQMLIDFSHNNPNTIPPDVVMEYTNLPFTVKARIKEFWEEQQEQEQANIEADRDIEIMKINATKEKKAKASK